MDTLDAPELALLAAISSSIAALASALAATLSWREQRARNRWDARRDVSLRADTATRHSEWIPDGAGGQRQTSVDVAIVTATNTGQRPVSVESIGIDFQDSDIGGYFVSVSPPRRLDIGDTVAAEIELSSLRAMLSSKQPERRPRLRNLAAQSTDGLTFKTPIVDHWREFPEHFRVDERVSRIPG
jgi:hypothetical protein